MGEEETKQEHAGHSEFERQPVPQKALLGLKSFVGMYAGEHCAGTELMIGPLFVAAGVSAFDVVVGLLIGNALAVLSWMVLCAPIATRARLTLYYQLEKICGRKLVTAYNLANGVMFCFLAGSMVTVSATAVGVWFKFKMPALNDLLPNSIGWIVAVFVVGALIAIVAAYGYKTVAKFANVAAPWMVLVFLIFGFVALRQFMTASNTDINSPSDLWNMAKTVIWKGGEPVEGRIKFTIWHPMFFAWFCNLAMHVGMADLSIFRFAKKSWYSIATAAGMYVGHFMAWLSASMLYALQLYQTPDNTDVLPGPMAFQAAGLAGLICVIIAGWTTANPTIYRAGLAFQAIAPKRSRFTITLIAGLVATIAGAFPLIAMRMLDFVSVYGMILMPMGAVIFVDFWLAKKLGFRNNYAELTGKSWNWAAGLAWLVTCSVCTVLVLLGTIIDSMVDHGWLTMTDRLQWIKNTFTVQVYFVSLPGWFLAAILYILVSKIYQKKGRPAAAEKGVSYVAQDSTMD